MRVTTYVFCIILISSLFYSCSKENGAVDAAGGTGKGGSLARFAIVGNHLYLADYASLNVYDISNPASPILKNQVNIGWGVETLFPYKDKLFIGSATGMFIYSLDNPDLPVQLSVAQHVRSCDPVVANESTAYVTLRGGSPCGPAEDGLYIYDVTDITKPVQQSLLKLSNPYGLGLQDSVVFVCRGANGLTAVNVKKGAAPTEMYTLQDDTYTDVIPVDDLLICYVLSGLLVYDMSDLNKLVKLGTFKY